ncbi:MAG: hypothetical protein DRP06_04295, partial [Candidatus Aenigmatarchaeota archaeon]
MKTYVFLILLIVLTAPCLADSYIITPPNQQVVISGFSGKEINCTPIYGTNSCSGELNETLVEELKAKGYKIYPNLKVYAFLDKSVPQIQADKLWNISVNGINLTGKGQTICIIDTGIDYNHSALGGGWGNKVIAGWRFLDGCTINNQSCNCTYNNSACYDDNGHGTHVAGIISSTNETYRGVAPDSKLVVVKVLNSSGSGLESDLISGINYCVDHSEEYNISVISMSLGDETYHNTTYCDNCSLPLTSAINNATAKNISVIVASGNEHNSTAISLPACIQNATPVGSVNGEDSISSFSNYWDLPILFAPGESIYSTWSNGWSFDSGTSTATPHVAGVFALMRQYLSLTNKTKTPQELEDLAISTGKNVTANENNSRIDAYNFYLGLSSTNLSECTEIGSSGYYNLTGNVSSNGTCFTIKAHNVTLDCKGYKIIGNTSGYGINITNYNNVTIKNCIVMNFSVGVNLYSSLNNILTNNTINNSSQYGIRLISSSNNTLINNTVSNNNEGILIQSSFSNTITNNLIVNNSYGVYLNSSSINLIYNNLFNNTNNFNFISNDTNYWNTTNQTGTRIYSNGNRIGGNYYTNSAGNGYSDTCVDSNKDGFCDIPYNLTGDGNNTDYLPLTNINPEVMIIEPVNWWYFYNNIIELNLSVNETYSIDYTNVSVIDYKGTIVNSTTTSKTGNFKINISVSESGVYWVNATTYDNFGGSNSDSVLVVVDLTNQGTNPTQINLSLSETENSTIGSFEILNGSKETILGFSDFGLSYLFNGTIGNENKSFLFLVPESKNLTANLTWSNNATNLTLELKNLRKGEIHKNTSSGNNYSYIELNSSNVDYGFWKAIVSGDVSGASENFSLEIRLKGYLFDINFTELGYYINTESIAAEGEHIRYFYVPANSIVNITLSSNGGSFLRISLYNSTGSQINSNLSSSGIAKISENLVKGLYKIKVKNQGVTSSYNYNLTFEFSQINFTNLGNLTPEKKVDTYFKLFQNQGPVDGKYIGNILVHSNKTTNYLPLYLNYQTPILKLKTNWSKNWYVGNQSLEAGENDYNTTRNLYLNINQSKTLSFIINNSGDLKLENLSVVYTNFTGSKNLSATLSDLSGNISSGSDRTLNLTIENPKNSSYLGNYSGYFYITSNNGKPFNDLNLTLCLSVVNKTIPRLTSENNIFYIDLETNLTNLSFYIYFYDNTTIDNLWGNNRSRNITIIYQGDEAYRPYIFNNSNSTNLTFNIGSNGLFSVEFNATGFIEGADTNFIIVTENLIDESGNKVTENLSFDLKYNIDIESTIQNKNSIVKGYDFILTVNVSKPKGSATAQNISVCLELPDGIKNQTPGCVPIGDLGEGDWNQTNFTLNGITKGSYTINITANSSDGSYVKTKQTESFNVRYGYLSVSLNDNTSSSKKANTSFTVYVEIENTGDWAAFINKIEIKVCDTTKTLNPSEKINEGSTKYYQASGFKCSSTGDKPIYVKLSGVENATNQYSDFKKIGEITITSSST